MIQIKKEKIASLSFGDIQLTSKANKWHLSELSETEEVNNQKVDSLAEKICNISIEGIINPSEHTGLFDKDPELAITINLKDNQIKQYAFVLSEEEDHYILKI